MKDIHLANVYIEYEHKRNWHKRVIEMPVLTDNIFEFNKYPHAVDFVNSKLPNSKKGLRFRVRKIEYLKFITKSFYYE